VQLRELGVLHLERKTVSSDSLTKLLDQKTKGDTALGLLRSYEPKKKAKGKKAIEQGASVTSLHNKPDTANEFYSSDSVNAVAPPEPVTRVLALGEEKKSLQEQLISLAKERSRIEKWGNFDPKAFGEFAGKGYPLIPYELPVSSYESLGDDTKVIVLGKDKAGVRLLSVGAEINGETPFTLSEMSLAEIDTLSAGIQTKLSGIEQQFTVLAETVSGSIAAEQNVIRQQIEFETARGGMEVLEDVPAETTVSWITGFMPADDLGLLKRAAAENGWAFIADDPGPDDDVPTKLKNNKFASLIYPLTDFLEVVPGYREVDISPYFMLFFCIFFGMIFGDAAYGAILLIAGIIGIIKTAKKGVPAALKLLLLLGLSNFIWGVLTCTWFGVDTTLLPNFLKQISLPLISTAALQGKVSAIELTRADGLVQQNLMIFCFSLALVQLSIGHILAIIRTRSLKMLGDIGSIAMLLGMYFIILSLIASNEYNKIPMSMPMVYVFAGGFVLNFIFANYDGSIGRSILESCKNIISVILGIANVFSDIMSYIRLWAVGLAGGAIAATIDSMAGPMLGHFIFFIFGVVLLVFGHGLNLVLNVLSVLVHGVRLNTLEFSGHAGLTWAGNAYKPFAKPGKGNSQ
jgi:V/A-type H+-transporting ATPase subunit I